ncbi:hypothetical protein [Metabacillus flavus]|nr:hypothetical protein [Metabacillus flavus]
MPGKREKECDARQECQANVKKDAMPGKNARQECQANGKVHIIV